jgi:hypothetical protein
MPKKTKNTTPFSSSNPEKKPGKNAEKNNKAGGVSAGKLLVGTGLLVGGAALVSMFDKKSGGAGGVQILPEGLETHNDPNLSTESLASSHFATAWIQEGRALEEDSKPKATFAPTDMPTTKGKHTESPTKRETKTPTRKATGAPTKKETNSPTREETKAPTKQGTKAPTPQVTQPTGNPTFVVSPDEPTEIPNALNNFRSSFVPQSANSLKVQWGSGCYDAMIGVLTSGKLNPSLCFYDGEYGGRGCQGFMDNPELQDACKGWNYLWYDTMGTGLNGVIGNIRNRMNRDLKGQCFNYADCSTSEFKGFSTCMKNMDTKACTWAELYEPMYVISGLSEIACVRWGINMDGQGDTYSCYGLIVSDIENDQPYKAGAACSECPDGYKFCSDGLCAKDNSRRFLLAGTIKTIDPTRGMMFVPIFVASAAITLWLKKQQKRQDGLGV